MCGQLRQEVGQILSMICKITSVQLIKGGVCPDYVHMYIFVPPKMKYIKEQESSRIEG